MKNSPGFSLIELIVVVLFLALAGSAVLFVFNGQEIGALENEAQGIKSRLSEVQTKAAAGVDGLAWGMHFENATSGPLYAAYSGTTYVSSSASITYMSNLVEYSVLPVGSSTNILFTRLTGASSASTTISIRLKNDAQKTRGISVTNEGRISVVE